ncbi:MAG: ComF family protein [Cyanobacteria bacterium RM1_2_2]|nr:ComF family protein [Cyanobacteria bacterium RM1_2_2]
MQRFSRVAGLSRLANLCLESACPLCQRSTAQALCLDCQRQLQHLRLSPSQQTWRSPLPIFAWGSYSGSLKRALTTLKYENQPQLARPLGDWLAQSWLQFAQTSEKMPEKSLLEKSLIVVPIPMHLAKQQQRGFNQAELLAEAFCQRTRLPLNPHVLMRNRSTEAQFGLSIAAREQNLADAFTLNETVVHSLKRSPHAVLLLDDIYTSGATARSAAQTLRQQNIAVYGIVTVAKTTIAKTTIAKTTAAKT